MTYKIALIPGDGIGTEQLGADGAQGLLEMRQQGACNVVQDENSSVVWGMPGAAVKLDAVDKVVSLGKIYKEIINHCKQ